MSFTYNDSGIRTSKTINGVTHRYYLNDSQIVAEQWADKLSIYLYDASGSPIGMMYRTDSYAEDKFDLFWFEKNLQGDIVAVYDNNGAKVVTYMYNDAWGNHLVSYSNGGASTGAQYNPFRYRGYYYDPDLGMYYLQSRYYDAKICRFINADGYVSTGQGILGNNMYAYCGNNPVMRVDHTGEVWWVVAAVAVVIVACTVVLSSCSSNSSSNSAISNLANAPDLDIDTATSNSYNCYGNGIGKQIIANPSGYTKGDSTRETFEAVKKDLGADNVRELSSINDPIGDDEFMVAMKCGPSDYHFIRLTENGWYNKSGTTNGLYIDQAIVESSIWYAMWSNNGKAHIYPNVYYDDETIYFAVKVGWDKQ